MMLSFSSDALRDFPHPPKKRAEINNTVLEGMPSCPFYVKNNIFHLSPLITKKITLC